MSPPTPTMYYLILIYISMLVDTPLPPADFPSAVDVLYQMHIELSVEGLQGAESFTIHVHVVLSPIATSSRDMHRSHKFLVGV